jgi:DUF971 family protein
MAPLDWQIIGEELAIKWDDGTESFLPCFLMRRHCPCAGCQGEKDILGNVYRAAAQQLGPLSYRIQTINRVGTYALQPVWGDGHATGIYSFDYLRALADRTQSPSP